MNTNDDLPILDALHQGLSESFDEIEAKEATRRRRRWPRRLGAGIIVLVLLAPAAVATEPLWQDTSSDDHNGADIVLRSSRSGPAWSVRQIDRTSGSCLVLSAQGASEQLCVPVRAPVGGLIASRVSTRAGRYIMGTTARDVETVRSAGQSVRAMAIPGVGGVRVYVIPPARGTGNSAVRAYSADGRILARLG